MKVFSCRLCKGNLSEPKLKFPPTPLANEFLKEKVKQDLFPLEVCMCESCEHYQLNEQVDPERMFRNYLFVAGTSPVNVAHFKKYAEDMVQRFEFKPGARVLDIASNDGTLLNEFQKLGMSILGIDPARNLAEEATKNGIPTIPEFFTEEFADKLLKQHEQFDLITANNVFAHVPDMIGFAKGVKKILKPNGVFSFEVSYFGDVCDKTLFDTVYHEHTSYHTIKPLISFFDTHGLELFDVEKISNHGGSIRVFVQHKGDNRNIEVSYHHTQVCRACGYGGCETRCGRRDFDPLPKRFENKGLSTRAKNLFIQEQLINQKVKDLQKNIKYLGLELREKLRDYKDQGKSIAIYGTPAKATTLMYALGIKEEWIDFAVDDAPLKQGTFTPGKHIPVYTSQAIIERKPDVLLILAWNFSESIIKNCKKLWQDNHPLVGKYRYPTFVTPLPELKVERYCENQTCTCGEGPFIKDDAKSGATFAGYTIDVFQCQACGGHEVVSNEKVRK
jgi:SAM-dependent methyltransferase